MNISDMAQEILERYWAKNKECGEKWEMEIIPGDPIAMELMDRGYARNAGERLELTKKGWDEARSCIRRHRLAERLMTDVLDIRGEKAHELGCRFEHVLQKDVEENICTLLGHPAKCPHGSPIPQGACCIANKKSPHKIVRPLSEFDANEKGKIVYLRADKGNAIEKLTAMGVLPGLSIQLLGKRPTYLFKMGESQFAIDKKLAENIMVKSSGA